MERKTNVSLFNETDLVGSRMDSFHSSDRTITTGNIQMNVKDFNLDGIVILTTRSTKTSRVKIIFEYEFVDIEASNTCFRSKEKELELQCEILRSLGFDDSQIEALSYE